MLEETQYFELPADPEGTVFDPADDTFGPIMAALQGGRFEEALTLTAGLLPFAAEGEPLTPIQRALDTAAWVIEEDEAAEANGNGWRDVCDVAQAGADLAYVVRGLLGRPAAELGGYTLIAEAVRVIGEDRVPADLLRDIVRDFGGES